MIRKLLALVDLNRASTSRQCRRAPVATGPSTSTPKAALLWTAMRRAEGIAGAKCWSRPNREAYGLRESIFQSSDEPGAKLME